MDPVNQWRRNVDDALRRSTPFKMDEDSGEFEYHAEVFQDTTGHKIVTHDVAEMMGKRAFNRGMWFGVILALVLSALVNLFF